MTSFRPISELLAAALPQDCDCPAPRAAQLQLARCWRDHLGAAGAHSRPLLFTSGRLVVFVEAASWGNEIRHRAHSLAEALRARGIGVRAIEVKTQPGMLAQPRQAQT
ncbi:MAG: DUF721 domain-containing protein [Gammaproteobacteria bacterium]